MKVNLLVEHILKTQPETRDNDRLLQIKVWEAQGLYLSDSQKDKFLHNAASPETIRRLRQKLQEKGMYKATDRVRRMRTLKGLIMQQQAPSLTTERLEKVVTYVPQEMF